MQAFVPWSGDERVTLEIVEVALEERVLVQTAGGHPTKVRMLPPLNVTKAELTDGFEALERALVRVARRNALPIFDAAPGR